VKLHEADKKFFGFELPGMNGEQEYYPFTVMANPAVEVVTRLLRSLKAYLHQLGIKLSLYVDDGRVSTGTKEKTWSQIQFVLTVSQLCGWDIQWKKTLTEAVQQHQHLGFVTDSVQMRYWLPKEKEDVAMDMLQVKIIRAMAGKKIMALDLAKLLGWLNSMRTSHGSLPGVLTRTCQHLLGVVVNTWVGGRAGSC